MLLEEYLALALAQHVQRDAQSDHAEPGVDAHALPAELLEAFDHLDVSDAQRFLRLRAIAEPRQQDAAEQTRPVLPQEGAQRISLTGPRFVAQDALGFQLRVGGHARHSTQSCECAATQSETGPRRRQAGAGGTEAEGHCLVTCARVRSYGWPTRQRASKRRWRPKSSAEPA
jgi:hypothetical protein